MFRREYKTAAKFDKEISMDQPSKQMPRATVQNNKRMTLDVIRRSLKLPLSPQARVQGTAGQTISKKGPG